MSILRRDFLKTVVLGSAAFHSSKCGRRRIRPNFILIFCDDLGYGDLGCFGSTLNRTVHIDRMAREGRRFRHFYSTSGVCTPSRASLMTGCYPLRIGMEKNCSGKWVLFPGDNKGLNPDEPTVAEILLGAGYRTACIGKWHLGDQLPFLPTRRGFDYYFGIPYSNDMGSGPSSGYPPLPLLRNEEVIEAPVDQNTLTTRYTDEAIRFIRDNKNDPFFLYLAHTMVHVPLHSSRAFRGKSDNGKYGDAVEEIDWSTGRILDCLKELELDDNTLIVFTSDNGATGRGSNAPFSGGKAGTREGSMRVPCIMRWSGSIPAGTICDEISSTMDILPTFAALAGVNPPSGRTVDGKDIRPLLRGKGSSPHEAFYYYFMSQLQAVRSGQWKYHLPLENKQYGWFRKTKKSEAKLFNLRTDPTESNNVIADFPGVVRHLNTLAEDTRRDIGDFQLKGVNQRPPGWVEHPILLRKKQEVQEN